LLIELNISIKIAVYYLSPRLVHSLPRRKTPIIRKKNQTNAIDALEPPWNRPGTALEPPWNIFHQHRRYLNNISLTGGKHRKGGAGRGAEPTWSQHGANMARVKKYIKKGEI